MQMIVRSVPDYHGMKVLRETQRGVQTSPVIILY